YNGKILRIDPETGQGLPSNPFYDRQAPDAPRSKVWSLGLRNPFRFSVAPESGSHAVEDGEPGVFYIGDVGLWHWEEVNVADGPGLNFGWPAYEGIELLGWAYQSKPTLNLDAPNPVQGCETNYFYFQDLLVQARGDHQYQFPNPCQPILGIPEEVPHFVHTPPALEWANKLMDTLSTRVAVAPADGGEVEPVELGQAQSRVTGDNFWGSSSTGGIFYDGNSFPTEYHGSYFFADYSAKWIRRIEVNENHQPVAVHRFAGSRFPVTDLKIHPISGDLFFTSYPWDVWRISYGGNVKPTAVLEKDRYYGPSPLTVQFSAENSSDQNGDPLSYHWDFGDGSLSQKVAPIHTFEATGNAPQKFRVILTVTDTAGASQQISQVISLNNTPPQVKINSIEPGFTYSVKVPLRIPLEAEVTDAEHGEEELYYQWQTILHHNSHTHPEAIL
ncbi:MAG: PKD domain-containing protein, partial [Bacteroidota bacterium]